MEKVGTECDPLLLDTQKKIELIKFDNHRKINYAGYCKLQINLSRKVLSVDPVNENLDRKNNVGFEASFKCKYFRQKNIIFVFGELEDQDFALVFDDIKRCQKTYNGIFKNRRKDFVNRKQLHDRFLTLFFKQMVENDSLTLNKIIDKWIQNHEGNEREEYLRILKMYKENPAFNYDTDNECKQNINRKRKLSEVKKSNGEKSSNKENNSIDNESAGAAFKKQNIQKEKPTFKAIASQLEKRLLTPSRTMRDIQAESLREDQMETMTKQIKSRRKSPVHDEDNILPQPNATKRDVFFSEMNATDKMNKMLQLMKIEFSNKLKRISVDALLRTKFKRPIHDDHANRLAERLEEVGRQNVDRILNRTFFAVYEKPSEDELDDDVSYGIVDGNLRVSAIRLYNKKHPNDPINFINVKYILKRSPLPSEAIILSTIAGSEAQRDKLQYNPEEIIRNARTILIHQPDILVAQPGDDSDLTPSMDWKNKYENRVKDELSVILGVDPIRILAPLWRIALIADNDFEDMLPAILNFGTSIKRFEKICSIYKRRGRETVAICADAEVLAGNWRIFFSKLDSIQGTDFQFSLKKKSCYNYDKTDEEQLREIMSPQIFRQIHPNKRNDVMEAFLHSKYIGEVSREKKYPNVQSKVAYLAKKFIEWYAVNLNIGEAQEDEDGDGEEGGKDEDSKESEEDEEKEEDEENSEEEEESDEEEASNQEEEDVNAKKSGKPQKDTKLSTAVRGSRNSVKNKSGIIHRKKSVNIVQLSNIAMADIQEKYINQLLPKEPHVAALVCHIFKAQTKNLVDFPPNNVLSKSERYETADGKFNWSAYAKNSKKAKKRDA